MAEALLVGSTWPPQECSGRCCPRPGMLAQGQPGPPGGSLRSLAGARACDCHGAPQAGWSGSWRTSARRGPGPRDGPRARCGTPACPAAGDVPAGRAAFNAQGQLIGRGRMRPVPGARRAGRRTGLPRVARRATEPPRPPRRGTADDVSDPVRRPAARVLEGNRGPARQAPPGISRPCAGQVTGKRSAPAGRVLRPRSRPVSRNPGPLLAVGSRVVYGALRYAGVASWVTRLCLTQLTS